MEPVRKPAELLALHDVTGELFASLQAWFEVPSRVTLSLGDVDAAVTELGDPVMVAAMAMRKLQALRLLAQPGVRTSTDVVVTIVQDLDRALLQAPAMRLKHAAAVTDWDAELADLLEPEPDDDASVVDGPAEGAAEGPGEGSAPGSVGGSVEGPAQGPAEPELDPEVERFRELHQALHVAVRAVIEASDGEIRYLE